MAGLGRSALNITDLNQTITRSPPHTVAGKPFQQLLLSSLVPLVPWVPLGGSFGGGWRWVLQEQNLAIGPSPNTALAKSGGGFRPGSPLLLGPRVDYGENWLVQ